MVVCVPTFGFFALTLELVLSFEGAFRLAVDLYFVETFALVGIFDLFALDLATALGFAGTLAFVLALECDFAFGP